MKCQRRVPRWDLTTACTVLLCGAAGRRNFSYQPGPKIRAEAQLFSPLPRRPLPAGWMCVTASEQCRGQSLELAACSAAAALAEAPGCCQLARPDPAMHARASCCAAVKERDRQVAWQAQPRPIPSRSALLLPANKVQAQAVQALQEPCAGAVFRMQLVGGRADLKTVLTLELAAARSGSGAVRKRLASKVVCHEKALRCGSWQQGPHCVPPSVLCCSAGEHAGVYEVDAFQYVTGRLLAAQHTIAQFHCLPVSAGLNFKVADHPTSNIRSEIDENGLHVQGR